ncbi:MAG: FAD-dependent oxidoreductase [Candidatus Krumholzibacteriia bacterium]
MSIQIRIDGNVIEAEQGWSVLRAAHEAAIYIPSLCAHPDLPPQEETPAAEAVYHGSLQIRHDPEAEGPSGCGLCVVEADGQGKIAACATRVRAGMRVTSVGAQLERLRRQRLSRILAHHPHACLTCTQREGCTREPCSMNVPVEERCCELLGRCELQAVAEYVGIDPSTPRYVPGPTRRITSEPLFDRNPALCIACGRCVRACNDREVHALGWARDSDSRRWVGPLARTPVEAGCRLCGSCVEVCPTGALMDRGVRHAEREEALVPCRSTCPARTDVPRYVRLVAAGCFSDAAAVVAERAPLVEVLGQICFHPCEKVCRRHEVNGAPISICRIKRAAGERSATDWTERLPPARPDTHRSVAVVGGGPAGLVAAHTLHQLGHRVTLLDERETLGGMLAHAIPPFRLSREVVARETAALVRGVHVRTGVRAGSNGLSLQGLRENHDALVIATGAHESARLRVPGEDLPGVRAGLDFLADVAHGNLPPSTYTGRNVLVVGGGNVAVDCARAALRLGAVTVDVVCLEQQDEMPAYAEEMARATEEGIRFHHGWGIRAFSGNGAVSRVELKRCTRVFDEQGRFDPRYDETQTQEMDADDVILAVGQRPDRSTIPDSMEGVFLAGDVATGPGSVVEAIASGREAALAADRFLGGPGELTLQLGSTAAPIALGRIEGFASLPRLEPEPLRREQSLDLEALPPGLSAELACREANRCLRCDLRLGYRTPAPPPSRQARLSLDAAGLAQVPESDGVVRFYGAAGELLEIVGGADMRHEVRERLGAERAASFDFEPCPMYTQRQNELLSQYMEAHGRMPPGVSEDDDLDGLF